MGGSGYNASLVAGGSARRHASMRTPIWYWLEGPFHLVDMGCGPENQPHMYRSRTPLLEFDEDPDGVVVWCGLCSTFRYLGATDAHPILDEVTSLPHEDLYLDKRGRHRGVAIEQDNNVLRERVARELQGRGFVHTEEEIAAVAVEFGLPVAEVKKINAGLSAPETGEIELCRSGRHEMTLDNVLVKSGRRTCKLCYRERDRAATQARRKRSAIVPAQAA